MEIETTRTASAAITGATRPEVEKPRENATGRGPENPEAGSPTPAGPAVVSTISPSTLQSSRAENIGTAASAPTQPQNEVTAVAAQTTRQVTPSNEELSATGRQSLQTSRIDTVV